MKILVGLGNPGLAYRKTRHNIGFLFIDYFSGKHPLTAKKKKYWSVLEEGIVGRERLILVKPQTFMNLSGEAVAAIVNFYKIKLSDLLIIYDDINLETGKIRLRPRGSAGGHKGLQSIIDHLKQQDFPRLRIGVGRPPTPDAAAYVLSPLKTAEKEIMAKAIEQAIEVAEFWMKYGIEKAMSRFNR